MAPSTVAASATVRPKGPTVSWLCAIGITPARLVRPRARERNRARGGVQLVGRVDVVLEQNRDPVERSAGPLVPALLVERAGDITRIRVDLEDGAERGPIPVDRLDPRHVDVDEVDRR